MADALVQQDSINSPRVVLHQQSSWAHQASPGVCVYTCALARDFRQQLKRL